MIPNSDFAMMPPEFWANVRSLSQTIGYTDRKTKGVKVPSRREIEGAYEQLGLDPSALEGDLVGQPLVAQLMKYFDHRASVLNKTVRDNLMSAEEARELYEQVTKEYPPSYPAPMNKQKGEKRAPAYLTGMVNALIEAHSEGIEFDPDPGVL